MGAGTDREGRGRSDVDVSRQQIGGYRWVRAHGHLRLGTVPVLRDALLKESAEQPNGLVCDLREVQARSDVLTFLLAVADRIHAWPASPLVVLAAAGEQRRSLERIGVARRLPVAERPDEVPGLMARCPPRLRAGIDLAPWEDSGAAARAFVDRTLLEWQLPGRVGAARLIATELVENAVRHAGTGLTLRISLAAGVVGVAVSDRGAGPASAVTPVSGGFGLVLVDRISHRWGALSRPDGGLTVWAVLDRPVGLGVPRPRPRLG
jgi:hypothetical protein